MKYIVNAHSVWKLYPIRSGVDDLSNGIRSYVLCVELLRRPFCRYISRVYPD
jgi:hypothetical protein